VESQPIEKIPIYTKDTLSLTCIISGSPKPFVTWEKEGQLLPSSRTTVNVSASQNPTSRVFTVKKFYYYVLIILFL